jgi:[CysO sulfur-carrier protein]-S-L-cysteine hydrolase
MKLQINCDVIDRLKLALRRAGRKEIGGVLMGEFLGDEKFQLLEFSLQEFGGTKAHFSRDLLHNKAELEKFFEKTGRDYSRFNYLGEWHSHPSFEAVPSIDDINSMISIVRNPDVGVYRAVLLIVRLRGKALEMSVTEFVADQSLRPVDVEIEALVEAKNKESSFRSWWRWLIESFLK